MGRCAVNELAIRFLNGTMVIVGRLRSDFRLQTPLDSVELMQKEREQKNKRGESDLKKMTFEHFKRNSRFLFNF